MTSKFLNRYISALIYGAGCWLEDNYDEVRFGPRSPQADPADGRGVVGWFQRALRARGYPHVWMVDDAVQRGLQMIAGLQADLEWLYARLADNESRDWLVSVLAFRALGDRHVRLATRTPDYWDRFDRITILANDQDRIPIQFLNWSLHRFDLESIGYPIKLYFTPKGVLVQFVQQQYRCQFAGGEIAVQPGDIVMDGGGCWGDTALYFAHRAGPQGRIFSWEFIPSNLDILRRNLDLNPQLAPRVQIVQAPMASVAGQEMAYIDNGPGSSVHLRPPAGGEGRTVTRSIDEVVTVENLPRVDFIKLDIEGAELDALKGATATIATHRPRMAVALYHRLTDFIEIPRWMDARMPDSRFFIRHHTIHSEETILFCQ